jgi:3-mercaptopyruvate sulfurtransferase SseA
VNYDKGDNIMKKLIILLLLIMIINVSPVMAQEVRQMLSVSEFAYIIDKTVPVFVDSVPTREDDWYHGRPKYSRFLSFETLKIAFADGNPDKKHFRTMMSDLGITNDDHVVLYGARGEIPYHFGAFYLMNYFGHEKVSVLDGGLSKWREKQPITTEEVTVQKTEYKVKAVNKQILADANDVWSKRWHPNSAIIDARLPEEVNGSLVFDENKRSGKIQLSVNVNWFDLFKPDGTFKEESELLQKFEDKGIGKDKNSIVYGQAGYRASGEYFVLTLLGFPNVKNYAASFVDWANQGNTIKFAVVGPAYYVGGKTCKKCHRKQYLSWAKTKMAVSFNNLKPGVKVDAKKKVGLDQEKDYTNNENCLPCHTTGYGKPGGFVSLKETPGLINVQCEGCHGPGSTYVKLMKEGKKRWTEAGYTDEQLKRAGLVIPEDNEHGCMECHGGASPFNEKVDSKYKWNWAERVQKTHKHFPLKYKLK